MDGIPRSATPDALLETMLRVTDIQEAYEAPCIVHFDSYVPISFTACACIPGARYILIGDSKTQLLELKVPDQSLALSAFILVLGEWTAQGSLTGDGSVAEGLPVISLPAGETFHNAAGFLRLDIRTRVAWSCTDAQAEVRLGTAENFNRRIQHGRVQFLLSDDVLVGMRVLDLTEEERRILGQHIAPSPNRNAWQ
jgi:hypothetical protein